MPALLLFFLALSAAYSQPRQPNPAPCLARAAAERPYARDVLLQVVAEHPPLRAEFLIRTCGVREAYTGELEASLRKAGAGSAVLAAVREMVSVITNSKDGLRYVRIPPGKFQMGCASEAGGPCQDDERPAHEVRISKAFWIGQTEVTVGAFERFGATRRSQSSL